MKGEFVVVESPYRNSDKRIMARNIKYARACERDCLINRLEISFASHLLYPQPGILDDANPQERELGIKAGLKLVEKVAQRTVVYGNYEISEGMNYGIKAAEEAGRPVEYRRLPENWEEEHDKIASHHSDRSLWAMILKE